MHANLRATGVLSIVMVMSLRRFLRLTDAERHRFGLRVARGPARRRRRADRQLSAAQRFERLRGTSAYARFLRQLRPARWFEVDEDEARVERQGHAFGVFRKYLMDNCFFPTYRLADSRLVLAEGLLAADPALADELDRWTYKLRLTRYGVLVVKLERRLDDTPLVDVTRLVLEIQDGDPDGQPAARLPTQWLLAMDVAARFVQACDGRFVVEQTVDGRAEQVVLPLRADYDPQPLPLHDRHITCLCHTITCDGQAIDAQALRAEHGSEVMGFLENVVLIEQGRACYPTYKPGQVARLFESDSASWEDEICLITSETTFIFCPLARQSGIFLRGSAEDGGPATYHGYWLSIARGIEHVVALKNEVQQLERETTRLLEIVPDLTRKVTDGNLSRADRREIAALANGVATLFQWLPRQRDVLVASSVFRSSYATQKLQHLMGLLGIQSIERHIETNVEELNDFLASYNSIQLQQDSQQTNLIFSLLTIGFTLFVVPSFLADLVQINWLQRDAVAEWGVALGQGVQAPVRAFAALGPVAIGGLLVALLLVVTLGVMAARALRRRW